MGKSVNKVILVGNLGQDPEIKYTASGTAVCNLRVATNESYKDASGEWVEKTEWHSLVAWAKLAEICAEYLKKGSSAYFEGSLETRKWQDKEGNDKYSTEIKVKEMVMLGGDGGGGQKASQPTQSSQRPSERPAPQAKQADAFTPSDDLPF